MEFYTNIGVRGNKILYRGIKDGKRVNKTVDFFPSLFIPSSVPTEFKTLHDEYLSELKPGTIKDTQDFVRKYDGVQNFKLYGNARHEYSYVAEQFPGDIEWNISNINIAGLDIEVASEGGYAQPENPWQPIISIAVRSNDNFTIFGIKEFDNTNHKHITYVHCKDEAELLTKFGDFWDKQNFDIVTGWYVKFFDIPYLINRITKTLGENVAKRLSPWRYYYKRSVVWMNADRSCYVISGIATLDYMELYRKFAIGGASKESYKLDYICEVEIQEKKVSYVDEYGNLNGLYNRNHQLFIEYNAQDVDLIFKLEKKLRLIELALTLAYDMKVNYEDVFTQVRMWTILIYNTLRARNVIIPIGLESTHVEEYAGAYVKDPLVGLHKWIVSFDLTSLYPHLIMQYNISPDMFIEPEHYTSNMKAILSSGVSIDSLLSQSIDLSGLKQDQATITPNGQFFRTNRLGFLSELMEKMFSDRARYKKMAQEAKKEKEKETDPVKKAILDAKISRYDNLQSAKKVSLNSAYGALGNRYFILYDPRQAEAITAAGQLSIRWIANALNKYLNTLLKTEGQDYVIASDTDSVYLTLDLLVKQSLGSAYETTEKAKIINFLDRVCEDKLQPFIDKSYKQLAGYVNAYAQKMIMKREAIADKGIWTAKKRYILNVWNNEGVAYTKPKIKVTGLESIKSSTPAACREKIKASFEIIMNNTEADMIKFIADFKSKFKTLTPEEIASPRSINGLTTYFNKDTIYSEGTPIQVKGSLIYNHELKKRGLEKQYESIKEGEKIKYIYLKEPNPFHSSVISFPSVVPKEFDISKWINYNEQFNKTFVKPLEAILNVIGWKTEKKASLADFFGKKT